MRNDEQLIIYTDTIDGLHVATIKAAGTRVVVGWFISFMSIAVGAIVGSTVIILENTTTIVVVGWGFMVLSFVILWLAISVTEQLTITIDPTTKSITTTRRWLRFMKIKRKPVLFSGVSGFDMFLTGQKCYVHMLRGGSLPRVNLYVTSYDARRGEARGLVDWLKEHVPVPEC
jgi:hypothetical protein